MIALRTQRQPEQIPRVERLPRPDRLAPRNISSSAPADDPAHRKRVEPRRACLGLDQHVLNRPRTKPSPRDRERHQVTLISVMASQTQRLTAREAALRPRPIHRRTLEQRRCWLRFRPTPLPPQRRVRPISQPLTQRRLRTAGMLSCHRTAAAHRSFWMKSSGQSAGVRSLTCPCGCRGFDLESSHGHRQMASLLTPSSGPAQDL